MLSEKVQRDPRQPTHRGNHDEAVSILRAQEDFLNADLPWAVTARNLVLETYLSIPDTTRRGFIAK
jgi:hypothetical protein